MRVNMNKTKVMISWRTSEDGHVGSALKLLVAIHYSVIVVRNGYTRNAVV